MSIFLNFALLILFFAVISLATDFAVNNIKYIAKALRVRLFVLGILLGLLTTLPELFLGINALIDRAGALTVGNIFGGNIVKMSLVFGISIIFNREIKTAGRWSSILPIVGVIFFPIFLGLDGRYGLLDGLVMIGAYVGLVLYLYRVNKFSGGVGIKVINRYKISRAIIFSIIGVLGILLASHWIVKVSLALASQFQVSELVIGLLVFSIGTNLPEISVTLTSWRKKTKELSLSFLLSSCFSNILILGILSFARPIIFTAGLEYWITTFFLGLVVVLFTIFYHSQKKMDWREGIVLVAVYFMFITASFYFGILAN